MSLNEEKYFMNANESKRKFILSSLIASGLAVSGVNSLAKIGDAKIPEAKQKIKANPLKAGSLVGIVAPATAVTDPEDIAKANEVIASFGLKSIYGKNVLKGSGYKTRSVEERVADLHEMFANPNVEAIMCVRGGYGSAGLLDKLDYQLLAANPKIFCGYSDITAMHLAIQKMTGLVTFHSPVLLSAYTKFTEDNLKSILFGSNKDNYLINPEQRRGIRNAFPIQTIKSGIAKGELIGGNLSIVTSLMGTEYEIETKGKILFFEDVDEPAYRIDRMLTQMKLAGKLDGLAGAIIGKCENCNSAGQGSLWDRSIGEVYDYFFADANYPVISGLMIGHTSEQLTIPMGIMAELDADNKKVKLLEKPTN